MDNERFKMECALCGTPFEPNSGSFFETGYGQLPEEEEVGEDGGFTSEELRQMSDYELAELGLSAKERDELLSGKDVDTGAMCLCDECQKSIFG